MICGAQMTSPRECVAQADSGADRGLSSCIPLGAELDDALGMWLRFAGDRDPGAQNLYLWPQQSSSLHRCKHTYPRTTVRNIANTLVAAYSMYRRRRSTAAKLPPLARHAAHPSRPGQAGTHKHGRRLCSRSRSAGTLVRLPGNVCPRAAWQQPLPCLVWRHRSYAVGRRPDVGVLLLQRHVLRHDGAHFLRQTALTAVIHGA